MCYSSSVCLSNLFKSTRPLFHADQIWDQSDHKWDKSGDFFISDSVHFGSVILNLIWIFFPDLSHLGLLWPTLVPKRTSVLSYTPREYPNNWNRMNSWLQLRNIELSCSAFLSCFLHYFYTLIWEMTSCVIFWENGTK